MKFKNPWTAEPETLREMFRVRRECGYTVREDVDKFWRRTLVWWVLRCIPRGVKMYVIVQAATRNEPGNPGEVTAVQMMRKLEAKVV